MADFKPAILSALETLKKKELAARAPFKARAYTKVIDELKANSKPIHTMADLADIEGIGEAIKKKIAEILETGGLEAADQARADFQLDASDALEKVYGIGPAKSKALIAAGIKTIPQLRSAAVANPALLNDKQMIGLRYYEEILERIPRAEVEAVETILVGSLPPSMRATVVGSYRRGAADSGDIDVLLTCPSTSVKVRSDLFKAYITRLRTMGFMTEVLSQGDHKCLSIVKLPVPGSTSRRLDLLMVPTEELAYATLYFTGSGEFNVAFRKYANRMGYTLNEHALTPLSDEPEPPPLQTEKDIFDFLGLRYKKPNERTGSAAVETI